MRKKFKLETSRLVITEFTADLAESVHLLSLDDDNRRFLSDEVFETACDAAQTIEYLISKYESNQSPLVYPIFIGGDVHIGHIEAVRLGTSWEIGYHIGELYTNKGYATEAVKAFTLVIMKRLGIAALYGEVRKENAASCRVLEKAGFERIFDGEAVHQGEKRAVVRYIYRADQLTIDR